MVLPIAVAAALSNRGIMQYRMSRNVSTFENLMLSTEAMENRAIENGLLEKSFNNAQNIIEKLVYTDSVKSLKYSITINPLEN